MYNIGDIVRATAGRDGDRLFVVVGIIDEAYVKIANGKSRRADAPKRKKVKHIELFRAAPEGFVEGLNLKNGKFTNAVLRKIITEYNQSNEEN